MRYRSLTASVGVALALGLTSAAGAADTYTVEPTMIFVKPPVGGVEDTS